MVEQLPTYGPDGGAVTLMRVVGVWPWVIAALGIAIVAVGGFLLT
jgi:hypothetical protein